MRVLFLGDIMAQSGRKYVLKVLPELRKSLVLDFVVANGENASGGIGLIPKNARDLFAAGVDVLTAGNHIWRYKEVYHYLDTEERLLRPANYPPSAPGSGSVVVTAQNGQRVAVCNVLGRTYMDPLNCPFRTMDNLIEELPADVVLRIVDFHAEATSEKIALAYYLDGRVSAVLGTHTHVQTNDARILSGGTATVTDAGMCGVEDSVLGMECEAVLERFVSALPTRFVPARGKVLLCGVLMDLSADTGRAEKIELFRYAEE